MKRNLNMLGVIGLLSVLLLGLGACSRHSTTNQAYTHSINKGLNAVAENKLNRALAYFDNALTQQPKDKKAKAYRQQTQAYLDTQSQLKTGEPAKALATVAAGTKVAGGAESLAHKLDKLKDTVQADLAEYKQLNTTITAQLKVTDGRYKSDFIKKCQAINWQQKPYLKRLKPKTQKLIKQSCQSEAESSQSASSATVSATDQKAAAQMRQVIVRSDPGAWDSAALAQVPDRVIVAATKQSNEMGGDPGTTANLIAKQYPDIKKVHETSQKDSTTTRPTDKKIADQVRGVLANNQDFSKSVLARIPDSEILDAIKDGFMTNSDIAETAGKLLAKYPDLK